MSVMPWSRSLSRSAEVLAKLLAACLDSTTGYGSVDEAQSRSDSHHAFGQHAAGAGASDVCMTSPSPTTASGFQPSRYYSSEEEYTTAVADALIREYRAIVDPGIVLQVDMPFASARASERYVGKPPGSVYDDVRKTLASNVEVLNYAPRGIPLRCSPAARVLRVRPGHTSSRSRIGPHH